MKALNQHIRKQRCKGINSRGVQLNSQTVNMNSSENSANDENENSYYTNVGKLTTVKRSENKKMNIHSSLKNGNINNESMTTLL